VRFSYASIGDGLEHNANRLVSLCREQETEPLHLVGHSLGGLLILAALERNKDLKVQRVVLIGSPYAGITAADALARSRIGEKMLGRTLNDWMRIPRPSIPNGAELGVIAGNVPFGLGRLVARLPKPNDGVVLVEETRVPGAERFDRAAHQSYRDVGLAGPWRMPPVLSCAMGPSGMRSGFLVTMVAASLSGCANIGYYFQAVGGQMEIWNRSRPIEKLVGDERTDARLRERLSLVLKVREFASRELALPDNQSYRKYADLQRPFAVWNVFATKEFSIAPVEWCFPFAGCVAYRGYFSEEGAGQFAAGLRSQGHDVFVAGIPAYSTLGWFDDPVLNTFIFYPDAEIARLTFHELAHQVVYVSGDTVFNESFATAVELEGVDRWLGRRAPGRSAPHLTPRRNTSAASSIW